MLLELFGSDPDKSMSVMADAQYELREGLELVCYIYRYHTGSFPVGLSIFVEDYLDPENWLDLAFDVAEFMDANLLTWAGIEDVEADPYVCHFVNKRDDFQRVRLDEDSFSDPDHPGLEIDEYL